MFRVHNSFMKFLVLFSVFAYHYAIWDLPARIFMNRPGSSNHSPSWDERPRVRIMLSESSAPEEQSVEIAEMTDDELVIAILDDPTCDTRLRCLYLRFRKYHLPFIVGWAGKRWGIEGEEVEDIFQELFTDFRRTFRRYEPRKGSFHRYFMQTLTYRFLRLATLRKERRTREFDRAAEAAVPTASSPSGRMEGLMTTFLGECLSKLPLNCRLVITKRYLEGLLLKELSELLGISTRTLRRWENRGLRDLRECIRRRVNRIKGIR